MLISGTRAEAKATPSTPRRSSTDPGNYVACGSGESL